MGVKTLVTSFGQITGTPSDSSSLDAVIGVELINASTNTVLTGAGNKKVFVDTSSAPISITLPSGTRGQTIDIIDGGDNAGTNIITIIGTIDGAANTTIETDGGSRVFVFDSEWESGGGIERLFTRNAATNEISSKSPDTLVANSLRSGLPAVTFTKTVADATSIGANVDQGVSDFGNDPLDTNYTFSGASGAAGVDPNPGHPIAHVIDGNASGTWWTMPVNYGVVGILDLGTTRTINKIQWFHYTANGTSSQASNVTLRGSTDGVSYSSIITNQAISQAGGGVDVSFTDASLRYLEVSAVAGTPANSALVYEIKPIFSGYVTTSNTSNLLYGSGAGAFDTSTAKVYDETNTLITGAGKVNLAYSVDGGAYSSLVDQGTFQSLGKLTYTTDFSIQVQTVGAIRWSKATIDTPNTTLQITSDGTVNLKDGATTFSSIGAKGIQPISLTTAERDALTSVPAGSVIFNETTSKMNFYNGSAWEAITSA